MYRPIYFVLWHAIKEVFIVKSQISITSLYATYYWIFFQSLFNIDMSGINCIMEIVHSQTLLSQDFAM